MRITGLTQQAQPNVSYTVAATVAGTVTITLPATLAVGDKVSVLGESSNSWQIAQNGGQTVSTTNLSGNVATGQSWTAAGTTAQPWHWLASNAAGDVLVALANLGGIYVSTDAGANWSMVNIARTWISVDMTPSGNKMVAVAYGGEMFISTDRGTTWTPVAGLATNAEWESVVISDDGNRIVASVYNGSIYTSADGGATWTERTAAGTRLWRGLAASADGMRLTAVAAGDRVYTSDDAGVTWTPTPGDTAIRDWYRVGSSADGQVIAAAEHIGGGLYLSSDRGASWRLANTPGGDYTTVTVSDNGQVIAASITGGTVHLSTDGGATFTALTMPGTDNNWRAVAMSADGNMLIAGTGTFTATPGLLYTSRSNRTMTGTLGSITAGQNDAVELRYLGDGRFEVLSSSGGPFAIR